MRAGEFDVIDSIVETPERRGYFDFTPAYTPIEASIFFRKDISGITDLASLKGFPVGVKAGDQHIDRLRANGVTTVIDGRGLIGMRERATVVGDKTEDKSVPGKGTEIHAFLPSHPVLNYLGFPP